MTPSNRRKRFIAGAICPRCGGCDTTYLLDNDEGRSRHCVNCDFKDDQPTAGRDETGRDGAGRNGAWQPVRIAAPQSKNGPENGSDEETLA